MIWGIPSNSITDRLFMHINLEYSSCAYCDYYMIKKPVNKYAVIHLDRLFEYLETDVNIAVMKNALILNRLLITFVGYFFPLSDAAIP